MFYIFVFLAGIVASCVCCVASNACSLCCKTTSANSSRTSYVIMFALSAVAAWAMLASSIGRSLSSMEKYTGDFIECQADEDSTECSDRWSQLAVYRVFFGTSVFFAFMGTMMIGVKQSTDCRGGWQDGFWLFKILMWIGLIVAAFFIDNSFFIDAWGYLGISGAFLYMLFQGAYIIIFANNWARQYIEPENRGCAKCCVPFATLILVALVMTITVVLYVYYTYGDDRGGCHRNKFIISLNFILAVCMLFFGVCSRADDRGLLQPAVVAFYTTYLTWSAVAMTTDECLPNNNNTSDWLTMVLGFLLCIYTVVGISSIKNPEHEKSAETKQEITSTTNDAGEKVTLIRMHPVVYNEKNGLYYNWAMFHWTLSLACMFMQNVLTNWAALRTRDGGAAPPLIDVGDTAGPIWVQAVAGWITVVFYLWSVLAMYIGPVCCPSRDWEPSSRSTSL
eukprot:m.149232 g.149232  ORF g.149232 m.149232 type:complete len:450 (+) comp17808_c0_seq1:328-1677(+)